MLVESHLPEGAALPKIPGYVAWVCSRAGARRASGGMVVLVHESLAPHVQPWQPSAQQPTARSPFHFWLRFDAASGLHRPLYLAAAKVFS